MQSQRLKVVFLNLPYESSISRRYSCTYYSPMFLHPPHDLLQLATCVREWNGSEIAFLDAIREQCDLPGVNAFLARQNPDVVVALAGIESVGADIESMNRIKAAFPHVTAVLFGYYPTVFSDAILRQSAVDLILRGEPEEALSAYLSARAEGRPCDAIPGLAGRRLDGSVFVNPETRIQDLDRLPFPDHTLVDVRKYEEGMLRGSCGTILSARGCPFRCLCCTTTYGYRMVVKRPETVVAEIQSLVRAGARVIRFLDDTFTFNRARVIEICRRMLQEGVSVKWACLSRVDTVDAEMLDWMKRAGCVRILVGVESYSNTVLEYLNKTNNPEETNAQLRLIRNAGIEMVGFFIVGSPVETEADFQETVRGALASPMDWLGANILTPYAGTPFFEQFRDDIVFSLFPYECRFKDESIDRIATDRKRRLYYRFYFRPKIMWLQLRRFLRFPYRSIYILLMLPLYQIRQFHRNK